MRQAPARGDALDPGEAQRRAVRLIGRHVRLRFALGLEVFAERVLEIARGAFPDGPWPECAARLSLDDLYLATACARGEEAAWEECAARYFTFMRTFARRRLPAAMAEDLANDVIADLWQRGKIARFEGRSSLRTWLGAVVAHAAANALKAERSRVRAGEVLSTSLAGVAPETLEATVIQARTAELLSRLLREAIGGTPGEDRLLLLLYYEQELTLDQIAALFRTSKSTLSRRLSRLREELRAAIQSLAAGHSVSAGELRAGVDFASMELDLGSLLREPKGLGDDRGPLSKAVKGGAP